MEFSKNTLLNIFFPKFCLGCNREGTYLCQDCQACLEILESNYCLCDNPKRLPQVGKCPECESKQLDGLYFPISYQNKLARNIINQFINEPFIKELAKPLTSLIITHFLLLDKGDQIWKDKILIPIPLPKKELKKRGYNPAEELAKNLSKTLEIPFSKTKIENRNIILINDIYNTGTTMEKAAKTLKESGAKEVWGLAITRK